MTVASSVSSATTRVDVAALPGAHVAVDERAHALVAERRQRRLLALLGHPLVDRLVRALERAVDRGGRRVERVGDLGAREAEDVAQDQHRALPRRQVLQRGDERELDALALLVARLGPGDGGVEPELRVGVGLDPHRSTSGSAGASCGSVAGP